MRVKAPRAATLSTTSRTDPLIERRRVFRRTISSPYPNAARDGRQKPEVSAPGQDVRAAKAKTPTSLLAQSGTSMAAPVVSGIIALLMAEAQANQHNLTCTQIHELIRSGVQKVGDEWHERYGWGRVDAQEALVALNKLFGDPKNP